MIDIVFRSRQMKYNTFLSLEEILHGHGYPFSTSPSNSTMTSSDVKSIN